VASTDAMPIALEYTKGWATVAQYYWLEYANIVTRVDERGNKKDWHAALTQTSQSHGG